MPNKESKNSLYLRWYGHFFQGKNTLASTSTGKKANGWADFIVKNPDKLK
jgi:hypothetical protein